MRFSAVGDWTESCLIIELIGQIIMIHTSMKTQSVIRSVIFDQYYSIIYFLDAAFIGPLPTGVRSQSIHSQALGRHHRFTHTHMTYNIISEPTLIHSLALFVLLFA